MDSVAGAVVVVTGGASGIGLALAQRFAQEGARSNTRYVLEDPFWVITHGGTDDNIEARFAAIAAASTRR